MTSDKICFAILSKSRFSPLRTLEQFPVSWLDQTALYVPEEQVAKYQKANSLVKVLGIPETDEVPATISAHRQYVMKHPPKKAEAVFFMDDDLRFNTRTKDNRLTISTKPEMKQMLQLICNLIDQSPMVGVSARVGNNRVEEDIVENARLYNCYCIHIDAFHKTGNSFRPADFPHKHMVMEDMYANLYFLTHGIKTLSIYSYAQGDLGANAKGGCSTWRTPEVQEQSVRWLVKKFPGIVSLKVKETKASWEGFDKRGDKNVRVDAVIHWKKAYEVGLRKQRNGSGIIGFFRG